MILRSLLFLPGNNPSMIQNGDILGADAVILDLEDAVSPDEKDAARILVRNAISTGQFADTTVVVRINPVDDTGFWKADLEEVIPHRPQMIMPTKVADGDYVKAVDSYISALEAKHGIPAGSTRILPLIETAIGLENAFSIACASPRIEAIFLGAEDLSADLRCPRTKEGDEIFYARCRMVSAARAAGIACVDTPFTDTDDDEGLYADSRLAKALGFSGKAAISPRHVAGINTVFSPTQSEIDYAYEVLAAIDEGKRQGKGAVSLRGKMIDKPIVMRAQQVLELAKGINGGTENE